MGEQTDRLLLEVEFTHRWYRDFLKRLRADGYVVRGLATPPGAGDVALRHDVDLSLEAALEMARIEADLGVTATYFVMLSSPLYNPLSPRGRETIRRIEGLGHEVGVHVSTHAYPELDRRPPLAAVEARVAEERAALSGLVDSLSPAVSFHIPPDWLLGASFSGVRSTYAPDYFEDPTYVADSSQRWRGDPPQLSADGDAVQVLTHPGLWAEEDADFEGRVEQAIVASCRRTQQAARQEFLDGGTD
jgi:peptidoglycan/xylan/chitin deacetylase (PgdA/CDA1 family)